MQLITRTLASAIVLVAIGCGGGSSGGSAVAGVAGVNLNNGNYEGVGTFTTNIRVVDLGSNTAPVSDDCVGDISIAIDDSAADVLVGDGQCLTAANAASYTLVGGFISDTEFEGTITIAFSRVDHVLTFRGSRSGDVLNATFDGRTPQVGNLVIDWDGEFSAERP